jgi:hypothetical protein
MPVKIPVTTRKYSDYTPYPDLAERAVQGAAPTESYSNFGLKAAVGFSLMVHQTSPALLVG